MNNPEHASHSDLWPRIQRGAVLAMIVSAVPIAWGALTSPEHFFRGYLVGCLFWLGITLGCMVLLMVQYLTGGAWGILLRRILEAAVATLPLVLLLFVPLAFGVERIYPWAHSAVSSKTAEVLDKSDYLNVPFFLVRAGVYFLLWNVFSGILRIWSIRQEQGRSQGPSRAIRLVSAWGLVAYGLSITFASIDWIMSLEPNWYSTIYPPLFAVAQILSGMAFATVMLSMLAGAEPIGSVARPNHWRDLGNLLLAFVMCWAYLSFSQFLLIWVENLPEEIPWYLLRTRGGWQWIAMTLVVLQFAIPFLFLLSRDVKENPRRLAAIAGLVLVLQFVNLYWSVEAAFPDGVGWYWIVDLGAWIGLGGLWMWWFVRKLKARSLLPTDDPYFDEYLPLEANHD